MIYWPVVIAGTAIYLFVAGFAAHKLAEWAGRSSHDKAPSFEPLTLVAAATWPLSGPVAVGLFVAHRQWLRMEKEKDARRRLGGDV